MAEAPKEKDIAREDRNSKRGKKVKEQQERYEAPGSIEGPPIGRNPHVEDRYEIIEGIRYEMSPSPTVKHQKLIGYLHHSMYQTCHLNGTILFAPMDVYLDEDNCYQPDLIFISHDNGGIIKKARIEGAPDLVAEILSPSTARKDKKLKKRQYERFGVKEYWILDPVHYTVDQYMNQEGKFEWTATFSHEEDCSLTSPLFPCISIDVAALFRVIA